MLSDRASPWRWQNGDKGSGFVTAAGMRAAVAGQANNAIVLELAHLTPILREEANGVSGAVLSGTSHSDENTEE